MRGLTFEELFALLTAVQLSAADLARLRILDARLLTTPTHLLCAAAKPG